MDSRNKNARIERFGRDLDGGNLRDLGCGSHFLKLFLETAHRSRKIPKVPSSSFGAGNKPSFPTLPGSFSFWVERGVADRGVQCS